MARTVGISRSIRSCVAALLALAAALICAPAAAGTVHPLLESHLANVSPGTHVPVIVELAEQADPRAAAARVPANRRARGRAVVDALRAAADRTQGPVRALIAQEESRGNARNATALWVFNGFVLSANEALIRRLAARDDVREVRLDARIPAPRPVRSRSRTKAAEPAWHIEVIRAPEVWAIDPRYNGTGIVIGSFDTGVDGTHPDLAPHYRGDDAISWFDPYHQHPTPYDGIGHGTHTVGTMVGGDLSGYSIGVAPGAKWIAAKGWNDADDGTASAFHRIFQWFLAPGDDPANAPQVVNHSWGLDTFSCDGEFRADVLAFRAAGIVPIFAAGNSGPDEGTVLPPGNYPESFTVGATDPFDEVSFFSSEGPSSCDGGIKPNISAPGEIILSTWPGGDYAYLDGTSMATPQVTAAAAILLSIAPALMVEDIETFLAAGSLDLGLPGTDNEFGAGRLDVAEAARIAIESHGQPIVGISATTPTAREAGLVPGVFTVRRSGATDTALTVNYTVSGTATPGADYVALPGMVTLPVGASSATIVVTPIDDAVVELDETVVVQLASDPAYVAAPSRATVTIVSDEIPPDLVVPAVTAPASAGAGTTITVGDTTKNQGPVPASASLTRYYLSSASTLTDTSVVLAERAVPSLAPGASHAGSVSAAVPAGTAAGNYWIVAKADGDDALVESQETNNTNATFIAIGPDLVVSAFTAPTDAGAGSAMSVTDTTVNRGGGAAGASVTRFFLSNDSMLDAADVVLGERSVPALAVGASHTGAATLAIPAGTATGTYYVIAQADGASAVAETSETNNAVYRTLRVGPDLVVSAFTAPTAAGAGAAISVTDTTKNQGGSSAAATTTRFFLSTDWMLDAGDVLLGARSVPALDAGMSNSGSTTLTMPSTLASGTYYLIAAADADSVVAETQETNNQVYRTVLVGADLVLSAFSAPADAGAGRSLTITDTTKNQGAGAAAATTTRFFLSSDWQLDAGDALLGARPVPSLAPGASSSGSTVVTIPAGTATGSYYVIARVDGDDAVAETYENNNTTYQPVRIGPDLVVSAATVPATAAAGASIAVSDTTKNQGGGAATASVTRWYLSADWMLDATDTLLGTRAVPALEPGASSSGSATLVIPAATAGGSYYLLAVADGEATVVETQEGNNQAYRTILIGTDLVVSAITAPNDTGAGLSITVGDTTKNQGAGAAAATTTRYYLSTDWILDAGDIVLGARAVPALAAGASDTGSVTVTVPAGIAAATYYLIAKADAAEVVAETLENNNTLYRTLRVGPDLVVSAFTLPASAGSGASISVSDTTKNQGGGAAPASVTRFYLSTDWMLDAGDTLLGSRAVPALDPGASSVASTPLTIPAGLASGSYYIIAAADDAAAVAETQEANNQTSRMLLIGPDLVVSSLVVPTSGGAGLPLVVSDTTRNAGAGAAAATTTRFFLSSDFQLDAADIALGGRAVPALDGGASSTGSTALVIPAGTATGTYYVIARADGTDAAGETNETNNATYQTIRVGPDLVLSAISAPGTAGAGAAISVSDTTKNQGGGAANASSTRWYLSTNATLDASDILLGSRAVAALDPGATSTGATSIVIPAGTAGGSYYLIAVADGEGAVAEIQEGNNQAFSTIVIGSDLVVSSLTVPSDGGAGLAITVTDTTRNQGSDATAATTTRFFLSNDWMLDAGDVLLGSRAVAALAPGASDTGSVSLTIPAGTATGSYYLIAQADGGNVVAETSEANNTAFRTLRVGPDLVVAAFTLPSAGGAGLAITVSDTTRNQGAGTAAATMTRFFLSSDWQLDAADIALGARAVPELAAGAGNTGSVTLTIPAGTATGTWYIVVRADGTDALAETYENNNTTYATIRIGPDLVVSAAGAPASASAGTTITLTDTTRNQGGGAAAASVTRWYLSTNSTLDGADVPLGDRPVPALDPGASSSGSATLVLPAGLAPGSYYLIAEGDGGAAMAEISEVNNRYAVPIQVAP